LIFTVDVESSAKRSTSAKGAVRRSLELLERPLEASGVPSRHLEPHTDRGDGVLILIRPHDEVPKTLMLGRFIPRDTAKS